jgi:hypothetical protein
MQRDGSARVKKKGPAGLEYLSAYRTGGMGEFSYFEACAGKMQARSEK